jgi:hypothetical protein
MLQGVCVTVTGSHAPPSAYLLGWLSIRLEALFLTSLPKGILMASLGGMFKPG